MSRRSARKIRTVRNPVLEAAVKAVTAVLAATVLAHVPHATVSPSAPELRVETIDPATDETHREDAAFVHLAPRDEPAAVVSGLVSALGRVTRPEDLRMWNVRMS